LCKAIQPAGGGDVHSAIAQHPQVLVFIRRSCRTDLSFKCKEELIKISHFSFRKKEKIKCYKIEALKIEIISDSE
jgi:hypothetical protein